MSVPNQYFQTFSENPLKWISYMDRSQPVASKQHITLTSSGTAVAIY